MSQSVSRCVTTGLNAQGQSAILADDQVSMVTPYEPYPCFQLQNLFYTEDNPQTLKTRHNNQAYNLELPNGAMRFKKIRMPTKSEMITDLKAAGQPIPKDWDTYNLHNTDSIDYIYILSGKITYIIGKEKLELQAGDFLAQIGPEHTWINDNDEPCYMLCVMIGIEPSGQRKKLSVE